MKELYSTVELLKILEALANPQRLKIISILSLERYYVSNLARKLEISRPLLYLHLQKLEEAGLVSSIMEISKTGKALKYYYLNSFQLNLNETLIYELQKNSISQED